MLGISTCWWDGRAFRGDEIVSDIVELGLNGVELDYRLTDRTYRQMRPQLNKVLTVLSIHNFFPRPEGHPGEKGSGDFFLLSSTDAGERSMAVKYSIRTIDHAQELGAPAVVFHLGRVDMPNPTQSLIRLYRRGKIDKNEGLALINEQRRIRKARGRKNLDAVLLSLEKLNREAEEKGIFLGIENRCHFHEIPDFEEIGTILREFKGGNVRYWHDVGHARVQENLAILRQRVLLEAYSEKMIGIHLHDVRGLVDHLPPGEGDIDYAVITPFLESCPIKVLEIHSKVRREELLEGVQFIKATGIGGRG